LLEKNRMFGALSKKSLSKDEKKEEKKVWLHDRTFSVAATAVLCLLLSIFFGFSPFFIVLLLFVSSLFFAYFVLFRFLC
jgi:lipopolysaccharide export LptBFGC system permease protein LptF